MGRRDQLNVAQARMVRGSNPVFVKEEERNALVENLVRIMLLEPKASRASPVAVRKGVYEGQTSAFYPWKDSKELSDRLLCVFAYNIGASMLTAIISLRALHSYSHSRNLIGGQQLMSDDAPPKKKKKREHLKRTRYDIYAELIRVVHIWTFCPLTRAARSTNMPVDRAKESITKLVERGLLEEDDDDGMRVFKVTVRGHQYLELYKRMAGLVGIPIPDPIIGM